MTRTPEVATLVDYHLETVRALRERLKDASRVIESARLFCEHTALQASEELDDLRSAIDQWDAGR